MQPVARKAIARCMRLRQLVFMVWKDKIRPAAMDIKAFAQIFAAHGRAFDMPARPPFAPGAGPADFAGFCRFPERKIQRVTLGLARCHARAALQVVDIAAGERAVFRQRTHVKIDVAASGIGMAAVDDALHQRDDIANMLRHARMLVCRQHVQRSGVFKISGDIFFRQRFGVHAFLRGALDDLIVNIGKVLYKGHIPAAPLEIAADGIEYHQRPRIAEVDIVVCRRSAAVNANLPWLQGHEFLFFPVLRVVKPDRHGVLLSCAGLFFLPAAPFATILSYFRQKKTGRADFSPLCAACGRRAAAAFGREVYFYCKTDIKEAKR